VLDDAIPPSRVHRDQLTRVLRGVECEFARTDRVCVAREVSFECAAPSEGTNDDVADDAPMLSRPACGSLEVMRGFFRHTGYLLILALAVVGAAFALHAWDGPRVVVAVNLSVAIVIALIERYVPYRDDWNRSHDDTRTDVAFMLLAMLPVPALFRAVSFGTLTAASIALARHVGHALWPSDWPIAAQLVLALVVAEFGQYWVHRLAHERAPLWRLHSVHHGVERLYWLNAGRFHPLDTLLQHAGEVVPLVLLGANAQVLALFTVFTSANGMLRHANADLHTGALNWVLSTADLHRWHHSVNVEESNANYGANLILWDVLFGSRRVPAGEGPAKLGLLLTGFPRRFAPLLATPWRWRW
jgi:sterol desaturase/sphingolipid hydroxylase (fatty acid hydroxylase superfamily)